MVNKINIEVLEEENPEDDIIEDLSDPFDISTSLDFLDGDNTSLYLAFKAYHQDQDFESAANHFQQSLAYAQDNGKEDMQVSQSGSIRVSEPDDSQAKSKYWLAESYLKIKQSDLAVDLFQDLVNNHRLHYLSLAAERRLTVFFGNQPAED